jgi:hypothetical protein
MPVWGSVQVRKASRFSSDGKPPPNDGYQPDVSQAQLESPPAPMAYNALRQGPDFEMPYEGNQAPPIDGSKDFLRVLSPFMIQVEPPLILGEMPNPGEGKKDYAGILAAGHSNAPKAFNAARNRIKQDMPAGAQLSNGGSVEQFVSNGYLHKPAGGGQAETVSVDRSDLGPSRIGTPALADLYTAVDITTQLRGLVNTPPLILLINPQTLTMSYTKIQQFSDRTRYGFVFQAWGEEQPKLSISAKCGAFISGGRGVQFASRLDSAAWQNVQTAFQFYKHNGYIYDTVGKSNAMHMVGALSIHYDGWVYYGNMESFTYSLEEANQQGGITFDMEFVINAMVDTSKQNVVVSPMRSPIPSASDPRYQGKENRALPSAGDLSVGGPDGTVEGGYDFYSANGYDRGTQTAPDGQVEAPPSLGIAAGFASPKSAGGFVRVTPLVASAGDPAQRLPTPFGGR